MKTAQLEDSAKQLCMWYQSRVLFTDLKIRTTFRVKVHRKQKEVGSMLVITGDKRLLCRGYVSVHFTDSKFGWAENYRSSFLFTF